jgi:hypothetical protein
VSRAPVGVAVCTVTTSPAAAVSLKKSKSLVPVPAEPCGPSPMVAVVVKPLRMVPTPVSAASVIDPSSSAFGATVATVTVSGSRAPSTRAAGFCLAPVPKPLISWAAAGLSLAPRVPSGSSSSTSSGEVTAAFAPLAAWALSLAEALAVACLAR